MDRESIIPRSTVEQLVKVYEVAERNILEGCRLIAASEKALTQAFSIGNLHGSIDFREPCHRSRLNYDDPKEGIEYVRQQIWRVLVARLEVRRMMSIQKAKELSDWLEKKSGQEHITTDNVLGFFRYYVENLGTMLEEQVAEVYDFLRPRSSSCLPAFKTNSEYRVGPRVILRYWVEPRYKGSKEIHVNYGRNDHYVALENVFLALDGRGSISKNYRTELEEAIGKAPVGETTYFRYRAHLNGTLHVAFKRMDLVQKFNAIAGGRRLKKGADDAAA